MTFEKLYANAKLTRNPFPIVPVTQIDDLVWAGETRQLERLLAASRAPRRDERSNTEMVVIMGDFGSGKSHHAKYLGQRYREAGEMMAYLDKPHIAGPNTRWFNIVRELFSNCFKRDDVIKRLGNFRAYVINRSNQLAEEEVGGAQGRQANPDRFNQLVREKRKQTNEEILPGNPGFVDFIMDLSDPSDPSKSISNWRLLASPLTAAQSATIAAPYNIAVGGTSTDHDASKTLVDFIKVITYPTPEGPGSEVVRIIIDECEEFAEMGAVTRRSLLEGLRDLFNGVSFHLFVALCVTTSDSAELFGIFDQPLMQRITRPIFGLPTPDAEQAKTFLREELSLSRAPGYEGPAEWPFTEDGLEAFVNECPPPLSLRKLNCSADRLCFDTFAYKTATGEGIDAADVGQFDEWCSH